MPRPNYSATFGNSYNGIATFNVALLNFEI